MLYANTADGRSLAQPGMRGRCAGCGGEVIAKCGEINIWHWAHVAAECDSWHEPETQWHLGWKQRFPSSWTEVSMGPHRADVRLEDGTVVEFQHSAISPAEIEERERFYRSMIWVFDASEFRQNLRFVDRDSFVGFTWKWARPSIYAVTKPMFFDIGDGKLFEVRKLYPHQRERGVILEEPAMTNRGEVTHRIAFVSPRKPAGGWGNYIRTELLVYRWTKSNQARLL